MVCCALMSCAKLVGIHDYNSGDAGGLAMGDAGRDGGSGGSGPVPDCSLGLSQNAVCPRSLAVGVDNTCVIAPDALYCWGQDIPNLSTDTNVPGVLVAGAVTMVKSSTSLDGFTSGFGTTCYLATADMMMCWGNSEVAQIQIATETTLGQTHIAVALSPIDAFAVGGDHVIATSGSSGACWGATSDNQCNSGAVNTASCDGLNTYCEVADTLGLNIALGSLTVAGRAHTCTTPDDAAGVTCWGDNTSDQLGVMNPAAMGRVGVAGGSFLGSASALALGAKHTCAITVSNSETYCWGDNSAGQLGVEGPAMEMLATSIEVQPGTQFDAIAAGSDTTCAIDTAKNVWCWGADTQGAAGQPSADGIFSQFSLPTMTRVTDAIAIGVGVEHACAILASGAIECWGDNRHGELGDGSGDHGVAGCVGDCSWQPVVVKGR